MEMTSGLIERMKYLMGDAYKTTYLDFFIESGESDFKRLDVAMKLFKIFIDNIKNCDSKRFISFSNDIFIERILSNPPMHLMLKDKLTSTGNVVYNLKHDILTLACLDSITDPPHKIKQQVIGWINRHRSTIIHELIHYIDKSVGAVDIMRDGWKEPEFGTPEYYNSEHEFNAYFNQFVYDVFRRSKIDPTIRTEFYTLYNKRFDYVFDWLMDKIDDDYLPIMMNFNEKYRRAFITRLYKLFDYTFPPPTKKIDLP